MLRLKYYTAPWCVPCKTFSPIVDEVVSESGGKLELVKVDVDTADFEEIVDIKSVPTICIYQEDTLKEKHYGAKTKKQLLDIINKYATN